MSTTAPPAPNTEVGFTQSELVILRQATEYANNQSQNGGSTMADRGRGTSRHSQPSSRAASAASSHSIQGRISLDSNSLGRLDASLTSMIRAIQNRIVQLEDEAAEVQRAIDSGARRTVEAATAQAKRANSICDQLDALEEQMKEVARVCKKIRMFREKCDQAGGRLTSLPATQQRSRGPIPIRS